YLDLLAEYPEKFRVEKKDMDFLYDLFNRDGFHQSYYKVRNGKNMMALKNAKLTDAKQKNSNLLYEKIRKEWKNTRMQKDVQGYLSLHYGEPARLVLLCGEFQAMVEKEGIQKAQNQPISRERVAAQMNKTGNAAFRFDSLEIDMDEDLFLPMQLLNELRREGMEELEQAILASFAREAEEEQTALEPVPDLLAEEEQTGFEPVPDLLAVNEQTSLKAVPNLLAESKKASSERDCALWVMAETKEQMQAVQDIDGMTGLCLPIHFLDKKNPLGSAKELLDEMKKRNLKLRLALPHMVRGDEDSWYKNSLKEMWNLGVDCFVVRSPESAARLWETGLAKACMLDYTLYTLNSQAQVFYRKHGFPRDTVPVELNSAEIRSRENTRSELIVYGRTPMMITAQCLKKNMDQCTKAWAKLSLRDRKGMTFPVRCICDSCYNIIYNSLPTSLLKDAGRIRGLGTESLRVHLTTEKAKDAAAVVRAFVKTFVCGEDSGGEKLPDTTRGHFKRGVE
ncbi:MAG: DUF3656 domain-containing protein, partial [Lachnospiraceae bacterium]|nr:DUF3656 domain-containing protein [Lachnospiraceae bacterium]